ncbi:hypothetical protein QQ020_28780 [Fulvivirgaceae bacterium BMA12]|uniref:Uncharacterized protein n=1 Tax=Agaribacillus aureus TaxID=3051825 RepID=A0ABT8LE95_9BACT|nr:hypothetical protein [Fulvivirgaceae bacterium BMA12]
MSQITFLLHWKAVSKSFVYALLLSISTIVQAQTPPDFYQLKNPDTCEINPCTTYLQLYENLPVEVRYGVDIEDRAIYFVFPNRAYYHQIFTNDDDGIAINIVAKEHYGCESNEDDISSTELAGYLLPPMFKNDMAKNLMVDEPGLIKVKYGQIPFEFNAENVECNLLVVKKKFMCGYHSFSHLNYDDWLLLKTGLYRDSLISSFNPSLRHKLKKTLRFTVPFEKNQSTIKHQDIQPIYDSLTLGRYNITAARVKAYSSVEGPTDKNRALQESRAKSILDALQTFQNSPIAYRVTGSENWSEFARDIKNTRFSYLKKLSKNEVKVALRDEKLSNALEPILKTQRKAVVEMRLEYRIDENENDAKVLRQYFDQSIRQKQLAEAMYLQELIYSKIKGQLVPDELIDQLEIPESAFFGPLLNNKTIFEYEHGLVEEGELMRRFKRLESLMPNNPKIKFNITTLNLQQWTHDIELNNREKIRWQIEALEKMDISDKLVERLWINYYIVQTKYLDKALRYDKKMRR